MSNGKVTLMLLVVAALVVVSQSFFIVDEKQLALKFQFGEIIESDYAPGLHIKLPFVNNVLKFEDRVLTQNNPTEQFLTNEKKNLFVDFFVKWRITDAAQFYRATAGGDEAIAGQRLIEIIKDGIRGEFAKRTVKEVVSAERSELMDDMLESAGTTAAELGISIIDVRVKQLDLPDDVSESVFSRMRQERKRVANQLRAEGAEASERIRADADRQATVLEAQAYSEAQTIRGLGDATSADIYATAYNANPEFYSFHRSIEAYRKSIGSENDILVLEPDSEFFKYLKNKQPN